jgi:sirohydrochlorin ferrochelatase
MPTILFADNGSVKPAATLQLRQLAKQLTRNTGRTVHPVSFQHAQRISAEKLGGNPAQLFRDFLEAQLVEGKKDFILLPLFFGHSRAISSFVPEQVSALKQQFGEFNLKIAQILYPLPAGEPLLEGIIADHILHTATNRQLALDNIVLVDHGSPLPEVTAVRNQLAHRAGLLLADSIQVEQAVMERRAGSEYDFNGELLEHWLTRKAQAGANSAIVVLQFLLAGRHAGEDGDIVQICAAVMQQFKGFKVAIGPLISAHPALLDILQARLKQAEKEFKDSQV